MGNIVSIGTIGQDSHRFGEPCGDTLIRLGGIDIPFFAILIAIIVIGLVMLFSATYVYAYYYEDDSAYYFKRQLLYIR